MNVCIFGAKGGLGAAFVRHLQADSRVTRIFAGSRMMLSEGVKLFPFGFDLRDERSIADAAGLCGAAGPLHLIVVATGMLHQGDTQPEKSHRAQSTTNFERAFAINSIGPALIAKHFLPLLPRGERAVFAALSARVSSISDNRLGGWHAYRASKAALNMLVRNYAIELGRTHPQAIAVTLHPGTVDTALSKPFQGNVAEGKLFTPDYAARSLLNLLEGLTPMDSGGLFAWDGARIDF